VVKLENSIDVSVIYVNHNSSNLLINSITALRQQCCKIGFEVIIVDNGSSENELKILVDLLQKEETVKIKTIFSDANAGFGFANNLGAKQAGGKYLFFLNPDTLVVNDVLLLFYSYMETAPATIAACGGVLLNKGGQLNDSYGNFPNLLQEITLIGLGLGSFIRLFIKNAEIAWTYPYTEIKRVHYIVGADVFIRTSCFEECNGFDENFFLYYEETDLFKRLANKGYTAVIVPAAQIIHLEGGSLGNENKQDFNYRKFQYLLKSKRYYYRKHKGRIYLLLVNMIIVIQIFVLFITGKRRKSV
jgi:GT2 family glycosyltransferase